MVTLAYGSIYTLALVTLLIYNKFNFNWPQLLIFTMIEAIFILRMVAMS
jgi:hypothetical protein